MAFEATGSTGGNKKKQTRKATTNKVTQVQSTLGAKQPKKSTKAPPATTKVAIKAKTTNPTTPKPAPGLAVPPPFVPPPLPTQHPQHQEEAKYGAAPEVPPMSPQSSVVYQYLSNRLADAAAQMAQSAAWQAYAQRLDIPPWRQPGFYNPEWGLMNNNALRGSDVNWEHWQDMYPDNEPPIWLRQGNNGRDHAVSLADGGGGMPAPPSPIIEEEPGTEVAAGGYYQPYPQQQNQPNPSEEPITWQETYSTAGAPGWWQGLTPSRLTAETEFAAMLNALVPYLSPEDQQSMGAYLSRLFEGKGGYPFSGYNPAQVGFAEPPSMIAPGMATQYLSAERAGNILSALQNMASSMGKKEADFGPGYKFLSQISAALQSFGAKGDGEGMTRADYIQLLGALDPLLAETEGEALGAYGPVASMIFRPFFSAGALAPVSKDQSGRYYFGQPNRGWF